MPYTLNTAIRQILTPSHTLQGYERLHLTRSRFMHEKGIWVRRFHPEPQQFELPWELPDTFTTAPKLLAALKDLADHADEDCPQEYRSRHFVEALERARGVLEGRN